MCHLGYQNPPCAEHDMIIFCCHPAKLSCQNSILYFKNESSYFHVGRNPHTDIHALNCGCTQGKEGFKGVSGHFYFKNLTFFTSLPFQESITKLTHGIGACPTRAMLFLDRWAESQTEHRLLYVRWNIKPQLEPQTHPEPQNTKYGASEIICLSLLHHSINLRR